MSLTRAEIDFIEFVNAKGKDEKLNETDLNALTSLIAVGSKAQKAEDHINWGSASFSKEFNERLLSVVSDPVLFEICKQLLDKKTFESAPLRQVHLFSHLYGELLKRNLKEFVNDNPRMPEILRELNGKILLQNIYIFYNSKKRGEDATYDCVNNFLYMRKDELQALMGSKDKKVLEDKYEQIQKMFFDDIKEHVQKYESRQADTGKLKTVSDMSSSPAQTGNMSEAKKEDVAPATKKPTTIDLDLMAKQREAVKQHRANSTGRLFDRKSKAPIRTSKSDPLNKSGPKSK